MTTKLKQAARQALEFCEELTTLGGKYPYVNETEVVVDAYKTSTALREALAEQAEQEPVAWLFDWEYEGEVVTGWVTQDFETTKFNNGHNIRPLYAAPVRTKDLTDDEIKAIALPMIPDEECSSEDQANFLAIEVIRAVIAADREKNK